MKMMCSADRNRNGVSPVMMYDEMGAACSTAMEVRNSKAVNILIGKPEMKNAYCEVRPN